MATDQEGDWTGEETWRRDLCVGRKRRTGEENAGLKSLSSVLYSSTLSFFTVLFV